MDIKDVRPRNVAEAKQVPPDTKTNQRTVAALSATTVEAIVSDPVSLQTAARSTTGSSTDVREKANQVIDAINYATDATAEIENLVKSVDGIVEQADNQELPAPRAAVLEKEANQLIEEIRRKALTPSPAGSRPLAGDKVALELEEKLGKQLEVILPDDAKEAFGLGTVRLSTKDSIIQTRSQIEEARRRLDSLKDAVQETKAQVADVVTELEVALQNKEASSASIRDVDKALELTSNIRSDIKEDPGTALGSFSRLEQNALSLLE